MQRLYFKEGMIYGEDGKTLATLTPAGIKAGLGPVFAAGPEMLAALSYVLDKCSLYGPADQAREKVRAAIAAAKGN
jgi:hypothetical protein